MQAKDMEISNMLLQLHQIKKDLRRVLETKLKRSLEGVPFTEYANLIRTLRKTN
jgi:hypothetical protein